MSDVENLTEDQIVEDILKNLNDEEKKELASIKDEEKYILHHGFGTSIRNHYGLWKRPWVPVIKNGCDYAEDHPDQVSWRIIEKVREQLKKEMRV